MLFLSINEIIITIYKTECFGQHSRALFTSGITISWVTIFTLGSDTLLSYTPLWG